jgi:dipeptidyl aminopeptidase/acylaminoacyl peptidase
MSQDDGLDRRLTAWMDVETAPHAPTDLRMRFAEGVGSTRQRPAWATTERWISMETRARLGGVPRLVIVLATIGLLAALAAGAYVIGSDGPARNGRIAFLYDNDIYTVEPDGTDRQLLVEGSDILAGVAWSPDGTRLAYWTEGVDTHWRLTVVDADGSDPIVVASGDASTAGISGFGVAWSPDSSKLAFTTYGEGQLPDRFMVAAADGTTGAVPVGEPDPGVRDAAWSPDGKTIAFGSDDPEKGGMGLYLVDADGTDVRRLDTVGGPGWMFVDVDWSPDGRTIAAAAGPSKETWDIWEFAVDGSTARMVSDPEVPSEQGHAAYAPDGALAWGSGDGIMLLEEGGTPQTLAGFVGGGMWSPDGLLLATQSESAEGDLVIIDRDGTIVTTIEDIVGGESRQRSWQRLPG